MRKTEKHAGGKPRGTRDRTLANSRAVRNWLHGQDYYRRSALLHCPSCGAPRGKWTTLISVRVSHHAVPKRPSDRVHKTSYIACDKCFTIYP